MTSTRVCAVQPFFIIDQDLLLGTNTRFEGVIGFVRRLWRRFMKMRTLMVGCAAGEGHLDGAEQLHRAMQSPLRGSSGIDPLFKAREPMTRD